MFAPKRIKIEHEEFDGRTPTNNSLNPVIKVKNVEKEDAKTLKQAQEQKDLQTPVPSEKQRREPKFKKPIEVKNEEEHTKTRKKTQKQKDFRTLELLETDQQLANVKQRRETKSKMASLKPPQYVQSRRVPKATHTKPIAAENRQILSQLLRDFAMAHNWREASGVLSVLLTGTPKGTSVKEDSAIFLVSTELLKRFGNESRFGTQIKKLFEVWMGKLNWLQKSEDKRIIVMLELALFHLSQGNIQEAYNLTNMLIQDQRVKDTSTLKLLHGLISYNIWYTTNIPEQMQINGLNFYNQSEVMITVCKDMREKTGSVLESSNDNNALDIVDASLSVECASESSVGNGNERLESGGDKPRKRKKKVSGKHNPGFYVNEADKDSERENNSLIQSSSNFENSSIFLAQGVNASLVPIKLMIMHEDMKDSIESYRKLVNEMHDCAVKNLRDALYSTPPLIPALLPLIQILLLGDRIAEAGSELEKSCGLFDTALPFRLRAEFMESFAKDQTSVISSCCEEVLKRDPTCSSSIQTLIKLHKNGDYTTMNLLEIIGTHLDTVDGGPITWEEFASCLITLRNANISDYEDCISINTTKRVSNSNSILHSKKTSNIFFDARTKGTWRIRYNWWTKTHFSHEKLVAETQTGDYKLLMYKAASACHIYGPESAYVKGVSNFLEEQGVNDDIVFLRTHMRSPLRLSQILN